MRGKNPLSLCDTHLYGLSFLSSEACAQLHQETFPDNPWRLETFNNLRALPTVDGQGLLHAQELIGFYLAQNVDDITEILTFMVKKKYQKNGFGHFLLDSFLTISRAKGVQNIFLEVEETNAAALSLYQKVGFRQIGTRKFYYGQKGNNGKNALTLSLSFQ